MNMLEFIIKSFCQLVAMLRNTFVCLCTETMSPGYSIFIALMYNRSKKSQNTPINSNTNSRREMKSGLLSASI